MSMPGKRYRGILTVKDRELFDKHKKDFDSVDSQQEIRIRRRAQQGIIDLDLIADIDTSNAIIKDVFDGEHILPFNDDEYTLETVEGALSYLMRGLWQKDSKEAKETVERAIDRAVEYNVDGYEIIQTDIKIQQRNRDEYLTEIYGKYRSERPLSNDESGRLFTEFRDYGEDSNSPHSSHAVLLREDIMHEPHIPAIIDRVTDYSSEETISSSKAQSYDDNRVFETKLAESFPDIVYRLDEDTILTLHTFKDPLSDTDYENVCEEANKSNSNVAIILTPDIDSVQSEKVHKYDIRETDIYAIEVEPQAPVGSSPLFKITNNVSKIS